MANRSARLVRLGGGPGQQEIELGDLTTVGRQPTNTLQIVDRLVSKEHAVFSRKPGSNAYVLRDLDSRNGTYCNDVLVEGSMTLGDGDTVRIGSTSWRYVAPEEPVAQAPAAAPPVEEEPPASIHATVQLDLLRDFAPAELVADVTTLKLDYEKLRLAYTLSGDLHALKDIESMVDKILGRIFEWLPVDRGVVMMIDSSMKGDYEVVDRLKNFAVRVRPGVGWEGTTEEVRVPSSILRQAVGRREAVLSTDARMDARFSGQSVVLQGIRSSMTVPLIANERVLGVLHVDSLISTGLFTEKDLSALGAVARQASIGIDNVLMQRKIREETAARESLSRMLSPNLVDQIVSGELPMEKGGSLRRVSVLFSDVRGFTNLTERTPPAEMVAMMNDYFERVTNAVFKHQGTLDKYIGDAVMALWGAPVASDEDEARAVHCAIEMQQIVNDFNEEREARGEVPIGVGIGIATGQLIAGYMGSTQTLSYTVLGRGVNLSARLCGMAGPGEVLLAPATWEHVQDKVDVEVLDPIKLKGIIDMVAPRRVVRWRG
ncbi:MAG: FHA domain-containing protein [Deltaproteobacteria bacterium]|nr:FHA domain-containing protein [Deltaproteobacteria bacterium]